MPVSRTELIVALAITLAGFAARFAFLDELAIEHFDEGVYASNLWFPDEGFQYPDRFLYAPPLLPSLIEWSIILFSPARWAPLLPSLILGSLTVPLAWWSLRRWANGPAGIAAASLIALSDFHIAMSRSALTDAPMVFFLLLAVWLAIEALSKSDLRLAAVAGFATGLAWATKYNGWLPIAIAISGAGAAWMLQPKVKQSSNNDQDTVRFSSVALCVAVMAATACATWAPVWWDLQSIGGYARVADNHQNYVTGFAEWWPAAVRHEAVQRHYAGWPTLLSGWLAVVAAGFVLRVERSTWNDSMQDDNASLDVASGAANHGVKRSTWNESDFKSTVAISAALTGAIVLSPLIALGVWSLTELVASAVTLRRNQKQRLSDTARHNSATKGRPRTGTKTTARLTQHSEQLNWFGVWLHLAWLCGLILATPLYRPYPRLILPLLCVGWLATGLAVVRLLGRRLVAERLVAGQSTSQQSTSMTESLNSADPSVDEATAAHKESISESEAPASGSSRNRRQVKFIWLVPVVFLCVWRAANYSAGAWQDRSALAGIAEEAVAKAAENCQGEPGLNEDFDFVVYVYGEPGLFFHVSGERVAVKPIMDLKFAKPGSGHARVPTFVLAGPHAWKSPQFGDQLREVEDTMDLISVFPYWISDFVLLDDHAPQRLSRNRKDDVRLYRVQFR